VDIYHPAKFHPDRIRVFFCACVISRIKLFTRLFVRFFVLQIVNSQDARTDFDAKYVKRRGSAQGCALWGSQNQKLSFTLFLGRLPNFGSRPNNMSDNFPSVRPYVRPSTKNFFDFDEIWYTGSTQ